MAQWFTFVRSLSGLVKGHRMIGAHCCNRKLALTNRANANLNNPPVLFSKRLTNLDRCLQTYLSTLRYSAWVHQRSWAYGGQGVSTPSNSCLVVFRLFYIWELRYKEQHLGPHLAISGGRQFLTPHQSPSESSPMPPTLILIRHAQAYHNLTGMSPLPQPPCSKLCRGTCHIGR